MAIVKLFFDQDASRVEKYLRSHEREANPLSENRVELNSLAKEFVATQEKRRSRGNELIHIIQSFSPEESKRLTPEKIHEMGVELVTRFAPDHQYVVQTHTDKAHFHNHIALNPVSDATGKRIQNKKRHLHTVRELSNEISIENGLSVLPGGVNRPRSGLSEKVRRIDRTRGHSYIMDMANKANFARHHATGYDDYVAILNAFDIQARIEPENITYYYPGKDHGKRGRNLEPGLDKPGLERAFASNRARFNATPELRATLSALISEYRTPPRALADGKQVAPSTSALVSTRAERVTHPRADELAQSVIPIEEIQRAKTQNILSYCDHAAISIVKTDDGRKVLKGRDYVEVSDYTWTNHRNKTQGNAIDFVSSHRDVGFLQAVSILNNNPKLLLLEQHIGEVKKSFQSFYIPKGESAPRAEAIAQLSRWLGHPPSHRVHSELLKRQRVHVSREGVIRLFAGSAEDGVMEYVPQEGGGFQARRRGTPERPFLASHPKKAKELHVYLEPESFLRRAPDLYCNPESSDAALLVLLAPALKPIHQAVSQQRDLERVLVIGSEGSSRSPDPDILKFFDLLQDSLDPFHIDTQLTWEPPQLSMPTRSMSLERGLEREIRFP